MLGAGPGRALLETGIPGDDCRAEARRKRDAGAPGRESALALPLSLLAGAPRAELLSPASPVVVLRGGRAQLLLPPSRSAAPGPTSEEGGRSGRPREVGGCAHRAPGVQAEQVWEGVLELLGGRLSESQESCPAAFIWNQPAPPRITPALSVSDPKGDAATRHL